MALARNDNGIKGTEWKIQEYVLVHMRTRLVFQFSWKGKDFLINSADELVTHLEENKVGP